MVKLRDSSGDQNPKRHRKHTTRIAVLCLLDPLALLLALALTAMIMLHAWGANISDVPSIVSIADRELSVSDLLAVFIPITAISALNIIFHLFRHSSKVGTMLKTYFVFIAFAGLLLVLLVQSILLWSRHQGQLTGLPITEIGYLGWVLTLLFCMNVIVGFALSVQSELNAADGDVSHWRD